MRLFYIRRYLSGNGRCSHRPFRESTTHSLRLRLRIGTCPCSTRLSSRRATQSSRPMGYTTREWFHDTTRNSESPYYIYIYIYICIYQVNPNIYIPIYLYI